MLNADYFVYYQPPLSSYSDWFSNP